MGAGSFRTETVTRLDGSQLEIGVFTIIVVADYPLVIPATASDPENTVEKDRWIFNFLTAAEVGIFEATEGQIAFRIYLSDESCGLGQAESPRRAGTKRRTSHLCG